MPIAIGMSKEALQAPIIIRDTDLQRAAQAVSRAAKKATVPFPRSNIVKRARPSEPALIEKPVMMVRDILSIAVIGPLRGAKGKFSALSLPGKGDDGDAGHMVPASPMSNERRAEMKRLFLTKGTLLSPTVDLDGLRGQIARLGAMRSAQEERS